MDRVVLPIMLILLIFLPSPVYATTYYLAAAAGGGSDSNSGTLPSAPWLTPNHPVNCGDVIIAAASSAYDASNFTSGQWGHVTCASGNSVAWLKCTTFDACKISATSVNGMKVGSSYWGIQGWEVTTTGISASCFVVQPSAGILHHIIFANNVANGCVGSGFTTSNTGTTASADYIALVGNVIWNAAQTASFCDSGITIYEPIKSDSAPGTHIYIAGNFSFDNETPANCNRGSSTFDGEGIALDTLDGSQGGVTPYDQQIVVDNNIAIYNGGWGVATTGNGNSLAPVYFKRNTLYGNMNATNTSATTCGELVILGYPNPVANVQATENLVMTQAATACSSSQSLYAIYVLGGDTTDYVHSNFLYSEAGHNTGSSSSGSFAFGSNSAGTNPSFANPVDPGAPSCSGKTSVVDCMSMVIANFTPMTTAAKPYGYQIPSTTLVYDPLFPQWLCNVNLPSGLVTMGCLALSSVPAPVTITNVKVQ